MGLAGREPRRHDPRLRPPGRSLHGADHRRRRHPDHVRHGLRRPTPLFARRDPDRLHLRSQRGPERLGHVTRRLRHDPDHHGRVQPNRVARLDARRRLHRLVQGRLPRRGPAQALAPPRRRRLGGGADQRTRQPQDGRGGGRTGRPLHLATRAARGTGPTTPSFHSTSSRSTIGRRARRTPAPRGTVPASAPPFRPTAAGSSTALATTSTPGCASATSNRARSDGSPTPSSTTTRSRAPPWTCCPGCPSPPTRAM